MIFRLRNLAIVAVVTVAPILAGPAAGAQVDGACSVTFNGVEASRVASLSSPLELDATDALVFAGTDEAGTFVARVAMTIGPVTAESRTTTYATAQNEFSASILLEDVSAYGIGLFRVTGTTDGCMSEVWVRVSGRFPLATLTGLTAVGLTLGGFTGQLGAIASRRRWARATAALGGVATGVGVAVIGQQFGRLQISYPSVGVICLGFAVLGFLAAWALNPSIRQDRRDRGPAIEVPYEPTTTRVARVDDSAPGLPTRTPQPTPTAAPHAPQRPAPLPDAGPYWCYVLAPTDVFDLNDHTATVATLRPGSWYLAKRTVSGWVHVAAGDGHDGWVAESAVHRQG